MDHKLKMSHKYAPVAKKSRSRLNCVNRSVTYKSRDVRVTTMIRGLEYMIDGKKLKELGLFRLQKKSLKGDLITLFKYLKGNFIEDGSRPGVSNSPTFLWPLL